MITSLLLLLALLGGLSALVSAMMLAQRNLKAAFFTGLFALIVFALFFAVRPVKAGQSATLGAGNAYFFLQTGTNVTAANGTVTNTFATFFSTNAAAVSNIQVWCSQVGSTASVSNVVTSVTSSNFIYNAGAPNVAFNYLVIGPPQ